MVIAWLIMSIVPINRNNTCVFTQKLVAAELPLVLAKPFRCLKSFVLFDCIDPENNYNNER